MYFPYTTYPGCTDYALICGIHNISLATYDFDDLRAGKQTVIIESI